MAGASFARVAVVGAGTMGNGIVQVFASHGAEVCMIDVAAEPLARGVAAIEASLARLVKKAALAEDQAQATRARIRTAAELTAARDAELVVEAVSERTELKGRVFAALDELCPSATILASNTSSISITKIAAHTRRADRVIGMHFMNPVPLMKLVEVIRGQDTSDETTARILAACAALGKTPVEAHDYPGFVSNRILMPMLNEAMFALMEGVSTAEGIDTVMKLGMNHPMGPLTLADFIGLDVCLDILEVLQREIGDDKYRACPLLRRMVAAGHLGRKTGRGFYRYD